MRITKEINADSAILLFDLISSSLIGQEIIELRSTFGYSFILKLGDETRHSSLKAVGWDWHFFACAWSIVDSTGQIIKNWENNCNINDIAPSIVGSNIVEVVLDAESLKIFTNRGFEFQVEISPFETEEGDSSDSTIYMSIAYRDRWALSFGDQLFLDFEAKDIETDQK